MRRYLRIIKTALAGWNDNELFLRQVDHFVQLIAKLLSIGILIVIVMSVYEVGHYMAIELYRLFFGASSALATDDPAQIQKFGRTLFTIFGLLLNVLIAIEILENVTAYLRKHVFQIELVIATSLIAVARKIIILDLEKTTGINLMALAATILALAAAYWVVQQSNRNHSAPPPH
jgi:uncharacterized membrane protein (DUF373 family)